MAKRYEQQKIEAFGIGGIVSVPSINLCLKEQGNSPPAALEALCSKPPPSSPTSVASPELPISNDPNDPKPRNYTQGDPENWKQEDIKEYLKDNQDTYNLKQKDITLLWNNEVCGRDFFTLTREEPIYHVAQVDTWCSNPLYATCDRTKAITTICLGFNVPSSMAERANLCLSKHTGSNFAWTFFAKELRAYSSFQKAPCLWTYLSLEWHNLKDKSKLILDRTYSSDAHIQHEAALGSMSISLSTKKRPFSSWTFNEFKAQFNIEADSFATIPRFILPSADERKLKSILMMR
ncbi:hypothetical protein L211DRAFT_851015 [Terfezia boudieri ATCC MYA-4762]|uniref:Uncharacterized protein n=1 Tax=Terfezia boudieri ATCC MYA-4762 TaxID=1051890 RepID=A0A3N4LJZ7_9PEZI|nr:hypothetical protein L211DRAFT_851015 [Terfezia boudieri ATCC MYA-4762]